MNGGASSAAAFRSLMLAKENGRAYVVDRPDLSDCGDDDPASEPA
jgi:hypothetical protein